LDEAGTRVARGISQYDSGNLLLVLRKKTPEVRAVLGKKCPEEVVHKNDLVVF